jgi:hypothetical protein
MQRGRRHRAFYRRDDLRGGGRAPLSYPTAPSPEFYQRAHPALTGLDEQVLALQAQDLIVPGVVCRNRFQQRQ